MRDPCEYKSLELAGFSDNQIQQFRELAKKMQILAEELLKAFQTLVNSTEMQNLKDALGFLHEEALYVTREPAWKKRQMWCQTLNKKRGRSNAVKSIYNTNKRQKSLQKMP